MARRIYAGADFFAMPSRFEPCGQGQMIALRYGTPPIVHRTGGLADTVIDARRQPGAGTGFVFDEPTPEALLGGCERAFALRGRGGPRGTACSIAGWRSTSTGRPGRRRATSRRTSGRSRSGAAGERRPVGRAREEAAVVSTGMGPLRRVRGARRS